jgi:hypothetical protein
MAAKRRKRLKKENKKRPDAMPTSIKLEASDLTATQAEIATVALFPA